MDEIRLIEVKEDILADNNRLADELRTRLKEKGTLLINIMSSPGSGKTSLILKTIDALGEDIRLGVIEADIESKVDAEKVSLRGVPVVQIRTGGFCHLDANMVNQGLEAMEQHTVDVLMIENVGNLVCPAEFDTGAHKNVMILSVPEGDDKPLKYPLMFSVCDVLLINKIDYLALADFDGEALRRHVFALNPTIKIFEVSCKTGEGIPDWAAWLREQREAFVKERS